MTSQQQLVCDSSTVANFKQWAQAISTFFSTAGWLQASDTGQVNWSTISSVPGTNSYVYEIWEPNDSLTNFYLKVEYGNSQSTANCPTVRLTIGTSTNGAGTITGGAVLGPISAVNNGSYPAPSTTTQYECNFSGAPGRMQVMMWRNGPSTNLGVTQIFSVERSISGGSYTGSHVTIITVGPNAQSGSQQSANQQTLVFGVGVAPAQSVTNGNSHGGLAVRLFNTGNTNISSAFNGSLAVDLVAPYVGYFDSQLTGIGVSCNTDLAEGITFTTTVYGSTRTYMPTKNAYQCSFVGPNSSTACLCMRYD